MATPYTEVYDYFLMLIDDYELASYEIEDFEDGLKKWLEIASSIYFVECNTDLINIMDDTLEQFSTTLRKDEIVILAYGMVLAWLEPKINTLEIIRKELGTKDFRITSSQSHLNTLSNFRSESFRKLKFYKKQYEYKNFNGFS
jgi:hypothetical protein